MAERKLTDLFHDTSGLVIIAQGLDESISANDVASSRFGVPISFFH
jgi:hypothetical protein